MIFTLPSTPTAYPSIDDVVWTTPSQDARGSMPLGNGEIGLNVWTEPAGDLLFTIGRTDSWDENSRLAKVGKVRLHLDRPLRGPGFRQTLRLQEGEITVESGTTQVSIWVDAHRSLIEMEVLSKQPVGATASFEIWRKTRREIDPIQVSDVSFDDNRPDHKHMPLFEEPDTVLPHGPDWVGWVHHNLKTVGPSETMAFQDLLEAPWTDPIAGNTFGGVMKGGKPIDDHTLRAQPSKRLRFAVCAQDLPQSTVDAWTSQSLGTLDAASQDFATRRRQSQAWWSQFWNRSHIEIHSPSGDGEKVAQAYTLQRFVTACAGRGAYPIKFNGSLFTTEWPGQPDGPDFRRWGPGYWWQNTRLPYESLSTSGDFDLLLPLFEMYREKILPVSLYRTKRYFGFDRAAYFPECVYPWGAVFPESYGWEEPAVDRTDKLQSSGYHKWEWVGGLELAFMMEDFYEHTGNPRFLQKTLLPTALPVLRFFDQFYKTGADGKLIMHPSQATETWWDCTNPMPEVAGLHAVAARLLELGPEELSAADRRWLTEVSKKLPELPTRIENGTAMLAPADRFADKSNVENPELYAVFPFRLVSFEKPNASLGVEAFKARTDRGAFGWRQEDLFLAYLGQTQQARSAVVGRATSHDPACRFPAFWGPNYDWTPDQCHGGVLMKAVQSMLMQTEGKKIFLFPAWPKEWDVDFKLHAPYQTVVEGKLEGGKLTHLKVSPQSRTKDVSRLLP